MSKKPPTLRDLAGNRELLDSKELDVVWSEIDSGNDRAAAILGATLLEDALRYAITSKFVTLESDEYRILYEDANSPLSSFSSMIWIGYALGLFGQLTRKDLIAIKIIRNCFAHAMKPITFQTPEVVAEVDKLKFVGWRRTQPNMLQIGSPTAVRASRWIFATHVRLLTHEILSLGFGGPASPPRLP